MPRLAMQLGRRRGGMCPLCQRAFVDGVVWLDQFWREYCRDIYDGRSGVKGAWLRRF
jgi:hypothetical protein